MARHKYIQKLFAVIEFVIIFLVIAFLLTTTVPGLLRAPQTLASLQDYARATIIKSDRNWMSDRLNLLDIGLALSFYRCNAVTLRVQRQQKQEGQREGHGSE